MGPMAMPVENLKTWVHRTNLEITRTRAVCWSTMKNHLKTTAFFKTQPNVTRSKMLWASIIQNKRQKCKITASTTPEIWNKAETTAWALTNKTKVSLSWHHNKVCRMKSTVTLKPWCYTRKCFRISLRHGSIQTCILKSFHPQLCRRDRSYSSTHWVWWEMRVYVSSSTLQTTMVRMVLHILGRCLI